MKKLNWVSILLCSGLALASTPACSSDDSSGDGDDAGDGDMSAAGDGDMSTAGDGDMSATGDGDMTATGDGDMTATGDGDMSATGDGDMTATGDGDMTATGGTSGDGDGTGGETSTDSAECVTYCEQWFVKSCNDSPGAADYADEAACLTACADIPSGGMTGDTIECRIDHLGRSTSPDQTPDHCSHAQATPTAPCAN